MRHGQDSQCDELDLGASDAQLESAVQVHLGRVLRTAYEAQLDSRVPQQFLKLLDELDRKQKRP